MRSRVRSSCDRVDEREQIGDGNRLDLHVGQALNRSPDFVLDQRLDDGSGSVDPFGHAQPTPTRDDGIWGRQTNIKGGFLVVAPDLDDVAESGRGDEADSRPGVFQHGIGGNSRTVHDGRDPAQQLRAVEAIPGRQLLNPGQDADGLIFSRGQDLLNLDMAGLVGAHQVGEGPTDIDPKLIHAYATPALQTGQPSLACPAPFHSMSGCQASRRRSPGCATHHPCLQRNANSRPPMR